MFAGKLKAVTFSYDDGITQDQRLIDIFNRYGLKATFNINSALLGHADSLIREGVTVSHVKPEATEIRAIYQGHEIASHSLTHPLLTNCVDAEITRQVEHDRLKLSELAGYEVVGFAYPGGGVNYNQHIANVIRNTTGIQYCRTTDSNGQFLPQKNLFMFHPTVYHYHDFEKMLSLGNRFTNLKAEQPLIFYIWGHSFEFDIHDTWDIFEEFCKQISNRDDIFYGTNREILLGSSLS